MEIKQSCNIVTFEDVLISNKYRVCRSLETSNWTGMTLDLAFHMTLLIVEYLNIYLLAMEMWDIFQMLAKKRPTSINSNILRLALML